MKKSLAHTAWECKYPIGSGGIESANKFICHTRMKRSGAWWVEETGNEMLHPGSAVGVYWPGRHRHSHMGFPFAIQNPQSKIAAQSWFNGIKTG